MAFQWVSFSGPGYNLVGYSGYSLVGDSGYSLVG